MKNEIDLLSSPFTRTFHLELTSNCNLRCVYCAVSQPSYAGRDMDLSDFEGLVAWLKTRRVETLVVNGHGETTMIHGWHRRISSLADAGFRMSMITNFARLLTEEELAAMARIAHIQVSIDTYKPEVLRQIRRRVSLGNILINMMSVSAAASRLGLPKPSFSWSCVVSNRVALDLLDYIHFGLACGVRDFSLCNLTKYDDVDGAENVHHVTTLERTKLEQFSVLLEKAKSLVADVGGWLDIQSGLTDSVQQALAKELSHDAEAVRSLD